jgi:hypothetical protein
MSFAIQSDISYLDGQVSSISPSYGVYNIGDIVYPRTSNYSAIFNIDNSSGPIVWNLSVDKNLATICDVLNIIMRTSNNSNTVTLNLNSSVFYTKCGESINTLVVNNLKKRVIKFIYDGVRYVGCGINCISDDDIIGGGDNSGGIGAGGDNGGGEIIGD